MNRTRFFQLFLLIAFVVGLSGCLGGGSGQTDSVGTTTETQTETVTLLTDTVSQIADGQATINLTVLVRGKNNTPLSDIAVSFTSSSSTAIFSSFSGTTDAQGTFTSTVTNVIAEEIIVAAGAENKVSEQLQLTFVEPVNEPDEPANIELLAGATTLSLNGSTSITAVVRDALGELVANGTSVTFTSSVGAVSNNAVTLNGKATVTFSASTASGLATVTATAGNASAQINLTIQPESAGTIQISEVNPPTIGVLGSGVTQTSTLTFLVKDALGNNVADGTVVNFSLGASTLGGGETISTQGGEGNQASASTSNGLVSVTLKSGRVSGVIDVVASVNSISTVALVTIVGGLPDGDHLSLAAEKLNVAGGVKFGLTNEIGAYVADRLGNIVPDGTAVSFISEGGTIGLSVGSEGFNATTELGRASATLQTAAPTTPNLGGLSTFSTEGYQCSSPYSSVSASSGDNLCGNPGFNTIVAYTTGSESFIDNNGNGQFDSGTDRHTDLGYVDTNGSGSWTFGEEITNKGDYSEPYIDANDNSTFDTGEFYIDVNSNGQFDGPNGVFEDNTLIWKNKIVLFSAQTRPILSVTTEGQALENGESGAFTIYNDDSQSFIVSNLSDLYGNALAEGARFTVEATGGVLGGIIDKTFQDSINTTGEAIFSLSSVAATVQEAEDGSVRLEYPSAASVTVTITLSSEDNGDAIPFVFSGLVNVRSGNEVTIITPAPDNNDANTTDADTTDNNDADTADTDTTDNNDADTTDTGTTE